MILLLRKMMGRQNDGKKEEDTNPLEEGSDEITALMKSYYQALGEEILPH